MNFDDAADKWFVCLASILHAKKKTRSDLHFSRTMRLTHTFSHDATGKLHLFIYFGLIHAMVFVKFPLNLTRPWA